MRLSRRLSVVFAAVLALTSPAFGQITWNFTYAEVQSGTNFGFNSSAAMGSSTLGQIRRDCVTATVTYLNTILDGRGTINATWNASLNVAPSGGSVILGSFGNTSFPNLGEGGFSNGNIHVRARTGTAPFASPDGSGQINFNSGVGWHYAVPGSTTTLNGGSLSSGGTIDLISVLAHEIGHGLGFLSRVSDTTAVNTTSMFSEWNRSMVSGSTTPTAMFGTTKGQANYGRYLGPTSTLIAGNNATNGLFSNGAYASEVYGGLVPLYAPNPYESGSSLSHVNDGNALMNPSVTTGVTRRFLPYEIAMMMDMGWNTYNWNATKSSVANTGLWSDGIGALASSRWTTDKGITFIENPGNPYNVNSNTREAPILPVYGQTTANIALNFNNSGTTSYTSTNDLGTVRLARLNLNSTSSGSTTIAGGTLNFGLNSNGSASVLVPKIVQSGSGAVTVSSAIQTNTIATQTIDGVTFTGHNGVTIEGTGTGTVTLSGVVSGDGGLTKNSSTFNLVLSGNNTYTGATTVNGGTLFVNGNMTNASGAVAVNSGGTLAGNGTVGGAVTVNGGGTLEGGNGAIGTLAVADNVTINSGGTLRAQVGSGTSADLINMTGSAYALDLKNGAVVTLVSSGFTVGTSIVTYTLADLNATDATLLKLNGVNLNSDTTITTFTSTGGINGTNVNNTGQVNIALSGFSLTAGDKFTLRRSNTGDLVVVFTPLPEPGGILAVCGLAAAGGLGWRRWRKRSL